MILFCSTSQFILGITYFDEILTLEKFWFLNNLMAVIIYLMNCAK